MSMIVNSEVLRSLDELAKDANNAFSQAEHHGREAVAAAIRCGESLLEAKSQVKHGEWMQWLEQNCPNISHRLAKRYMQISNGPRAAHLQNATSIREAERMVREQSKADKSLEMVSEPETQAGGNIAFSSFDEVCDSGKKYEVIYADPPWKYGNQGTRAATNNHYPTMTVEEIAGLPVRELVNERALLFLWTTNGFLFESQDVISEWGFTFKSSMIWVKPQMGIGNYVRNAHEFLLICSRGGLLPNGKSQISWIESSRTKHSKKPDRFRETIECMTSGSRIELFARCVSPGWDAVGNQIERTLIDAG